MHTPGREKAATVTTPKIEDVAAAAGVHRSTVPRAFSRPEAVKQETRDHVLELAKAMRAAAGERGYQLVLCLTANDATATAGYLHAMRSMYAPFGVIAPL